MIPVSNKTESPADPVNRVPLSRSFSFSFSSMTQRKGFRACEREGL